MSKFKKYWKKYWKEIGRFEIEVIENPELENEFESFGRKLYKFSEFDIKDHRIATLEDEIFALECDNRKLEDDLEKIEIEIEIKIKKNMNKYYFLFL